MPVGHQHGERQEFLTAVEADEVTGRTGQTADPACPSEPVDRNDALIRVGRLALQVELSTWWQHWK
eukprot:535240-Alexandrium_andersonii.AAC.1